MNIKLKNLIIFLSIVGFLVWGNVYCFLKNNSKISNAYIVLAAEYNCTSVGISQLTQRMNQLIEAMKKCSTNNCLINIKNELLTLTQKLQECDRLAQQKKQELEKETQTLKWKINYLDASISEKEANIYALNSQIYFLNNEINQINQEIKEIEEKIKDKKNLISYFLKKVYEYDKNNLILITLAQGEFSDFFNELSYIENLQQKMSESISDLRNNKNTLETKKQDLSKKKTEIETAKIQISQQLETLNYEKQEKNNLLAITEGDEAKYESLMAEIKKRTKEIYEQIYILESKMRGGESCLPNSLSWPIETQKVRIEDIISQYYGCVHWNVYPRANCRPGWSFHNGIDIAPASACGTPIKAPADGTIIAIGDMGEYAYGRWMVIKHDLGVYTLYAHLQSINASGRVHKGQVIAKMGTTGFSTGCHLHFMVGTSFIQNGNLPLLAHQNPLCYLK